MTAKRILQVDYDYDFLLIGICTHAKDYRLCWEINKILDIKLERVDDTMLNSHTNPAHAGGVREGASHDELNAYSLYFCEEEESNNCFHVISNKSSNETLITEQKQVDYFLRIKGNNNPGYPADIIKKLKDISIVLTAYEIDLNKLKSKHKFLF